jgi:hypothetical protein
MEGNVYLCRWKKIKNGFSAWLNSDPSVSVTGAEFEQVAEDLSDAICGKTGDGEAIIEFTPPVPSGGHFARWMQPLILSLGFNQRVETNIRQPGMYTGGVCSRCGTARGTRTKVPIRIFTKISGNIAASINSAPAIRLISEEFLGLLRPEESALLEFRSTDNATGQDRQFYELAGRSIAPWVSFHGARLHPITSWRCPDCNHQRLWPSHPEVAVYGFLCRSDLPTPAPSCFVAGTELDRLDLCMTQTRWKEIAGKKATTGFATSPIGLVDSKEVIRTPDLPDPPG